MIGSIPSVELFVRAAPSNKKEKGPCLVSQQWMMVLHNLEKKGLINLHVTPTSLDNPPENYVKLNAARLLPIAWIQSGELEGEDATGLVISSSGSLEALMQKLKEPYLNATLKKEDVLHAEKVCEDLYKNFMHYVRNNQSKSLHSTLSNLDSYLASGNGKYLLGNDLSYVDCQLMPRLQHIRVAGRAYKSFDIPDNFTRLWRYIRTMYDTESFVYSCPSDRDILMHYEERDPLPKDIRPCLLGPGYLHDIPPSVVLPDANGDVK
ncbi:Chloride intracellular channel protein 4 [Fasciolopsis buskii]|uniref:Chloride intracellular channel protein 4 n=1 Tax=Fasciolopsis buskii TaxID=27845 RepID=A0A8E0VLI4_9TREM|nr:Chloride intracellular channel protein 4 [Fasciolopsis buski]